MGRTPFSEAERKETFGTFLMATKKLGVDVSIAHSALRIYATAERYHYVSTGNQAGILWAALYAAGIEGKAQTDTGKIAAYAAFPSGVLTGTPQRIERMIKSKEKEIREGYRLLAKVFHLGHEIPKAGMPRVLIEDKDEGHVNISKNELAALRRMTVEDITLGKHLVPVTENDRKPKYRVLRVSLKV